MKIKLLSIVSIIIISILVIDSSYFSKKNIPTTPVTTEEKIKDLYKLAEGSRSEFLEQVYNFSKKTGGELIFAKNLKDPGSTLNKLTRYNGDVSKIRDLLRATVVYKDMKDLNNAIEILLKEKNIKRYSNRFLSPFKSGYRHFLVELKMNNGGKAELQLNLKSIVKVKEGVAKQYYEVEKQILANSVNESRQLTEDEKVTIENNNKYTSPLYDKAYREAGGY